MRPVSKPLVVAGILTILFLYVPIIILVGLSFNASTMGVTWKGFSLHWYQKLFADASIIEATVNSLVIAGISTTGSLLLGLGAAIGLEKWRGRHVAWLNTLIVLPLVIPEILLGVALLMAFVLWGVPLGFGSIIIGHMVFNLPLVVVILRARLRKLDSAWEDAARDLGASSWQVLWHITLPMLRPAIIGAALLSLTVSLDDFVVTFFVAGPGATTLPLKVFSMIKTGMTPEVNALSAVMVVVSMLCVGLSWFFQQQASSSAIKNVQSS